MEKLPATPASSLVPYEPKDAAKKSTGASSWGWVIKFLAGVGITAGIALHFLGHVAHQSYLSAWGIDPGLFPKPTDWTGTNGYFTLTERILFFLKFLFSSWTNLPILFGSVCLLIAYINFLIFIDAWEPKKSGEHSTLVRMPLWLRKFIQWMLVRLLFTLLIPIALFAAGFILALPASLGSSQGRAHAEEQWKKMSAGCENIKSGQRCVDVKKGDQIIASGLVLDSSESRLALFDTRTKRVRVLELSDLELVLTSDLIDKKLPQDPK